MIALKVVTSMPLLIKTSNGAWNLSFLENLSFGFLATLTTLSFNAG